MRQEGDVYKMDATAKIWYLWNGEKQTGPFSTVAMKKSIAAGKLKADRLVFRDGYEDWKELSATELWTTRSVTPPSIPRPTKKVARQTSTDRKLHDGTIAVLEMGSNCLLTLTDKHLRGQFLRLVVNRDHTQSTIKDQIDVLLNAVAGYSLIFVDKSYKRGMAVIGGSVIAIWGGWFCSSHELQSYMGLPIVVGILWGVIGWLMNPDSHIFQLNIMGSKTMIPVAKAYYTVVRDFINKLQNAKIAYDQTM